MTSNSVYLFDIEGNRIGEKPKSDIDKINDILETVYVKVFVGEKLLLSKIIKKKEGLPKMYEGKWGAPIATIIRTDESPEDAFKRASLDDIGQIPDITHVHPRTAYEFQNGSKRHVYEFEGALENIPENKERKFLLVSMDELKDLISSGEVAETYMKLI